jgi:hypothetical protein
MFPRPFSSALLALIAVTAAGAQERSGPETKRGTYVVKHAIAKELAGILAKHFKGAAEIQAGPEITSNCLLINASPAVFDEVMKLLGQIDRPARSVAVEVMIVELPPKKAEDKGKETEANSFRGSIDDVAKRLDTMKAKGQVSRFKRLQLTALQGKPESLVLREKKPILVAVVGTGVDMQRTVIQKSLGTIFTVTPHIAGDGTILLNLGVNDTQSRDSATIILGNDENGKAIPATEFIETELSSRISVESGMAVLASDARVNSKEGQGKTLMIVGARVIEAGAARK